MEQADDRRRTDEDNNAMIAHPRPGAICSSKAQSFRNRALIGSWVQSLCQASDPHGDRRC